MNANLQDVSPAPRLAPPDCHDAEAHFRRDVLDGLSRPRKSVPCGWLYDRQGTALFDRVTNRPEHYPSRVERVMLSQCAGEVGVLAGPGACLVELVSGPCTMTPILLEAMQVPACYVPVDVSAPFLRESVAMLQARFPSLPILELPTDFRLGTALPTPAGARRLLFVPGTTIGSLAPNDATRLLCQWAHRAGPGSLLVLDADGTQDPSMLLAAYDDPAGANAAFNLNLLKRMNRELGADFDLSAFRHAARFDTRERRVEMHLVSRCNQQVKVAGQRFRFVAGESIHTMNAYKYGALRVQLMAAGAGWMLRQRWAGARSHFDVHVFEHEA